MPERLASAVALAVIGVCLLIGSLAIAGGIRDRRRSDVLIVTGSAKRRIQSDFVIWNASLTSRQKTAHAASKELTRWTARFQKFLTDAGATKDAMARAKVLARATNADLGHVRSVYAGVFQVTSPTSTRSATTGSTTSRSARTT